MFFERGFGQQEEFPSLDFPKKVKSMSNSMLEEIKIKGKKRRQALQEKNKYWAIQCYPEAIRNKLEASKNPFPKSKKLFEKVFAKHLQIEMKGAAKDLALNESKAIKLTDTPKTELTNNLKNGFSSIVRGVLLEVIQRVNQGRSASGCLH